MSHNAYKPHPLKSFATNRMFATETPQYLQNLSEEKRAQIKNAAELLLTGEKCNVEIAAAVAVGFDCRRAIWYSACEQWHNKKANKEMTQSLLEFAENCEQIEELFRGVFYQIADFSGISFLALRG